MLKSCLGPSDLRIGSRHLLVTKTFTHRHAPLVTISKEQCRHRTYRSEWRDSRRTSRAATAPAPAEPKLAAVEAPKTRLANAPELKAAASEAHESRAGNAGSNPKSKSTASEVAKAIPQQFSDFQSAPQKLSPDSASPDDVARTLPKHGKIVVESVRGTPNQDLSSTRPAKIESPDSPEPDDNGNITVATRAKYLYALGRSYLAFYKTGLKNIWNNRKEYNEIKARLGTFTAEDAALYGGQTKNDRHVPTITRREYQLYLRTRHDLRKLIPFSLVLAVCGEFTPLVIIALGSSVVPLTCRIPKQVQADRKKPLNRFKEAAKNQSNLSDGSPYGLGTLLERDSGGSEDRRLEAELAFLLGISPVARPLPILHRLLILPRMRRRGLEILADTVLIHREGGFDILEPIEVCEYANKFFCPTFIWESKMYLEHNGHISWDWDVVKKVNHRLESHATNMLAHEWDYIPEKALWQPGLLWDSANLPALLEWERTGKMPDRDFEAGSKGKPPEP